MRSSGKSYCREFCAPIVNIDRLAALRAKDLAGNMPLLHRPAATDRESPFSMT
jgi:hypothetical protein